MNIVPSSVHSKKLRIEIREISKLTLFSTEEGYEEACERLRKVLGTRGYKKSEVQGEEDRVLWNSKQEVLRKREEPGKNSSRAKEELPGIPVVVPDNQGLREWWEECTREDITQGFGEYFTDTEVEILTSRMQIGKMKKKHVSSIATVYDQNSNFIGEIPHLT